MRLNNSIGKKLLWSIALPSFIASVLGLAYFWDQANRAMRASIGEQAVALSELISTTFNLADRMQPSTPDGTHVHRSVTGAVRANWKMFRHVESLRIIDAKGVVRWSRDVEEEGKPLADAARLLAIGKETVRMEAGKAEVVRPLGGMTCAGCHLGEPSMHLAALQLTIDEPTLKKEVNQVFASALQSLLVLIAALTIATTVSLYFFLKRRLTRLAQVMERAEAGDFLARSEDRGQDELGQLSTAFNRMLAKITSMKAEEIDTHRDLEAAQTELKLKSALEERLADLNLLFDVAKSFTSTLDVPELLSVITQHVADRLNVSQFSIMLFRDNGLEVKTALPPGRGMEGLRYELGEGACGKAAQDHKAVYIPDVAADAGIFERRGNAFERGSLLSVPMVHNGVLLGVLNFQRLEVAAFGPEELELFSAVADQAAIAVKNALLHEETVSLSITDPLTGVHNRRHLFGRLEMEIARANRFANQLSIVMIDIDHFKHLNDSAGHRAGDLVLRQVADLMRGLVRKVDTLARYGGEEFMVVLPQVTKSEAVEVAEKLRRAIEEHPFVNGPMQPGGRITISVGTANLPMDASEMDKLVDCADSALYASKRAGRNKVTAYAVGMELHPGRERGPYAAKRAQTGEIPVVEPKVKPS